jgi:hypothetical protein
MKERRKQLGAMRPVTKIVLAVIGVGLAYGVWWIYPTARDLLSLVPKKSEKQGWTPDTEKNLQALFTALKLQHESDGQFPKGSEWMDKVTPRLKTETLKKGAEKEKFVDPAAGGKPGEFGFAMNDAVAEKYVDDLKDKKMVVVFQSTDANWNAHGDPDKIGRKGGIGMALDGSIVRL